MDWLRIHVSNLCNFKCPNCHVFELGENNLPNRVMSQEVFNQSLDQFLNVMTLLGNKKTMVSLYGGETLANKKVIKDGINHYGNTYNGIKLNWVINTNGSLLKEEDILFFKEHNVEIHISVDGAEDVHNISRPTHKGKGTFHMVVPALELIKKHNVPAQINSYMMPSNYLHLNAIVDIANRYDIKKIYLDQFYNLEMITHKVGMEKYREVFFYAANRGVSIGGPWGRVINRYQTNEQKRETLEKKLGIDVNMDGTFYFPIISRTKKQHREIKDLTSFFTSGLMSEIANQARALYDVKCDGCSIKDICYGSAIEQVHYHIGEEAETAVSCNFFRDWCNFLLRPVYFKKYKKFDCISMLPLEDIDANLNEIEKHILALETKLWPLKAPLLVNVSEYLDELKSASGQTNLPDWVTATTSGDNKLHLLGKQLTPAIIHELTHLFIAQRKLRIPKWFAEGFCEWTQNTKINPDVVKHAMATSSLSQCMLSDDLHLIDINQNIPELNPLYIQAKAFVAYLNNLLGNEAFKAFICDCEDHSFEDALFINSKIILSEHFVKFKQDYI